MSALWLSSITIREYLEEFPESLLGNQHNFRAIGYCIDDYVLLQREFIPHLLLQPQLSSLSLACDRIANGTTDFSSLVSLFEHLSDTLITLKVGNLIANSSGKVAAAIFDMRRLEQICWMSSRLNFDTKGLILKKQKLGQGIKWLRFGVNYDGGNLFIGGLADVSSVNSLHITCSLDAAINAMNACHGLKTINWTPFTEVEFRNLPDPGFITRHWKTLTRLRIFRLDTWSTASDTEGSPLWHTGFLGEILKCCTSLIELAIPIPSEIGISQRLSILQRRRNRVKFQTDEINGVSDNRLETPPHLISVVAQVKYVSLSIHSSIRVSLPNRRAGTQKSGTLGCAFEEWPQVSNNLRCLQFLNQRISTDFYHYQCPIDEYWPIVLTHLLTYLKTPFGGSETGYAVPLPCLQAMITGPDMNEYNHFCEDICETWRVVELKDVEPALKTPGGV
ncbi:hypothetical protein TWF481_010277 [Arthrobotrys musiformis]|uniref:Uncharacterized protein n=1 Tax=Arthrobotrys musiformis TaxID=47236 RepID=A0AAV9W276_9PEZI